MSLRWIPLLTGLLPIVAIHGSLWLAINTGAVSTCLPYIDGCASISATGRYLPAAFLFKPAMTIEVVLLVLFWSLSATWIRSLARLADIPSPPRIFLTTSFGIVSAIALLVYVTFLGTQEPIYEFMRRFGIYFYFLFMVIAQFLLARQLLQLSGQLRLRSVRRNASWQMSLSIAPFALGILNLVLKSVLDDADSIENAIEWQASLLMHLYFLFAYFSWRDTAFEASTSCLLADR